MKCPPWRLKVRTDTSFLAALGGHFELFLSPQLWNRACSETSGGQPRNNIAALDATTGLATATGASSNISINGQAPSRVAFVSAATDLVAALSDTNGATTREVNPPRE